MTCPSEEPEGRPWWRPFDRFTFRPLSTKGPWWFRSAWAGWYWLEFSLINWGRETYPKEPAFTYTITVRLFGHIWTARFKKER
jgi:hypothetical protein